MAENTDISQIVTAIYEKYFAAVDEILSKKEPFDGLFGIGKRMDSYPCHDEFFESLKQALENATNENVDSENIFSALKYIYEVTLTHANEPSVYWMLIAAHSLTECVFVLLSRENAAELYKWYADAYPRMTRLPAQKEVVKKLNKAAGL